MAGLHETVIQLREVMVAPPPSAAFAARVEAQALAELPAPGQAAGGGLQEVIARLLGEEGFRKGFFAAPEDTLRQAGIQLTAAEMAALKEMEPEDLDDWFTDLDERISKSRLLDIDLDD
jgi:hypothetical protein